MSQETKQNDVQKWLNHIAAYDKEFKKWDSRVDKIIKRYRDEQRKTGDVSAKFNILWSNVQTLVPATFSRLPQPDVSRRFKDNDPVGRVAALIIERALDFEIQHYQDYRATMKQCVHDRFLGGRGTAWARYEPHIRAVQVGEPEDGTNVTEDVDEPQEELDYECAPVDYVHWKDFGHTSARTWEEVTAVWRRVYMTRQACVERFGEKGEKIPLDAKPEDVKKGEMGSDADYNRALIYEIWNKETKQAIWISKSLNEVLDERDDPLGLEGFFPCPKPLYATLTNESLIPVPDFTLYQDQANTLDVLSDRICGLVEALQVKGVYNSEYTSLGRLFTEGVNNTLIPVKNWQAFAEKQGLKGAIDIVDLTPIFNALTAAYQAVEEQKQQIYDITGLADIVRGQSMASETATAQQIKGQYASLRLNAMKQDVSQFATDCLRLKAQIMCSKFDPMTLLKMASVEQLSPQDKEYIKPAIEMLSNEPLRSFRIDIAADSLVQLDEQEQRESRTEFVTAVGGGFKAAMEASQVNPEIGIVMLEAMKFAAAAYKAGKQFEGVLDEAIEKIKQQAAEARANPKPDPEQMKLQAEQQAEQQRMQMEAQKAQAEQMQEQARMQADMAIEQARADAQLRAEQQRIQMEQQAKEREQQFSASLEQRKREHEAMMESQRLASEESFNRWKAELEAATKIMVAEISAKASLDQSQIAAEKAAASEVESAAKQDKAGSQMVDMHAKTMEALKGVMETIARPKKIVRGADGKVEGIE